jgi:hypothetical protein
MLLAMSTAAKVLILGHVWSMELTSAAVPGVRYWVGYPLLLLTIVLMIFVLQPVLTLRSSETKEDFWSAERRVR